MARFFAGVDLNTWIIMITPLFFIVFLLVVFGVMRKSSDEKYNRMGNIPFDNEENSHGAR